VGFSVTALSLVNRVNRRRRMPDVAAFNATEDQATLDALNTAIDEVCSSRRWEFDIRRAQMTLRPRKQAATGETLTATAAAGASQITVDYTATTLSQAIKYFYGDFDAEYRYITRVLPTGSSDYGNTAFRVLTATPQTSTANAVIDAEIGTAFTDVTAELFYAEYVLPDTVRSVIRVTHQDDPVTLEQVDATVAFDELYPRPQIEYGTPEVVSVGGFERPTRSTATVSFNPGDGTLTTLTDEQMAPGLRMTVWPVPDEAYVLDFTYHYRHPELTATTSTLEGVPPEIVDQIVDLAAISMKGYYDDADSRSVARYKAMTMNTVQEQHRRHSGNFAERKRIGNWDGSQRGQGVDARVSRGRLLGGDS
jgi:hypothetical protein